MSGCANNISHFQCTNRKNECIPRYLLCDGEFDCTDGSDEDSCQNSRVKRGKTIKIRMGHDNWAKSAGFFFTLSSKAR